VGVPFLNTLQMENLGVRVVDCLPASTRWREKHQSTISHPQNRQSHFASHLVADFLDQLLDQLSPNVRLVRLNELEAVAKVIPVPHNGPDTYPPEWESDLQPDNCADWQLN
jgi:hypothetical protein